LIENTHEPDTELHPALPEGVPRKESGVRLKAIKLVKIMKSGISDESHKTYMADNPAITANKETIYPLRWFAANLYAEELEKEKTRSNPHSESLSL